MDKCDSIFIDIANLILSIITWKTRTKQSKTVFNNYYNEIAD